MHPPGPEHPEPKQNSKPLHCLSSRQPPEAPLVALVPPLDPSAVPRPSGARPHALSRDRKSRTTEDAFISLLPRRPRYHRAPRGARVLRSDWQCNVLQKYESLWRQGADVIQIGLMIVMFLRI